MYLNNVEMYGFLFVFMIFNIYVLVLYVLIFVYCFKSNYYILYSMINEIIWFVNYLMFCNCLCVRK